MKKRNLLAAMLVAGALIIGTSCKKESKETGEISKTKNQTDCATCEEGKELALKIKAFGSSLEMARKGEKTGGTMPLNDAIDQMELLVNASHGFPFEEYGKRVKKKVKVNLNHDASGNLSTAQVASTYDQMLAKVKEAYAGTELEEKGLAFVGLSLGEEQKGETEIDVYITIGGSSKGDPFTECWYYGNLMGKCDGSMAWESDAAQEIWPVVENNNPIYTYNDCPGSNYRLIIDPLPREEELQGHEFEDISGNKLLFWLSAANGNGQFTNEELQLSIDEMNQYYSNEMEVVYNLLPEAKGYTFPEHILVEILMEGNQYVNPENGDIFIRHHNKLRYAARYWVEKGILPDPIPIN